MSQPIFLLRLLYDSDLSTALGVTITDETHTQRTKFALVAFVLQMYYKNKCMNWTAAKRGQGDVCWSRIWIFEQTEIADDIRILN